MPRARSIKPGFFTNEALGSLPVLTRLLYIGLWTLADRSGRLEYRPKRIKAQIFPFDSVNVEKCLGDLAHSGLILIYEVDSDKYIAIPTWDKHQHPHHKEPASKLPAPVLPQSCPSLALGSPQSRPGKARLTPDSGLLTPDSGGGEGSSGLQKAPEPPMRARHDKPTPSAPPPDTPAEQPPGARAVSQMLVDFAGHLGAPDDAVCLRLLNWAEQDVGRIEAWLWTKAARRKSIQSWGWFLEVAEAELRQFRPVLELPPERPPADNVLRFDPGADYQTVVAKLAGSKAL